MISINKALSALFLLISIPLFAQSYHGEVRGLVTDPSHAVIAGAKVTLVDEARHVTRIAVSDGAGIYIFSDMLRASQSRMAPVSTSLAVLTRPVIGYRSKLLRKNHLTSRRSL
ncbi:MAG: carboxypeptidase-like regulatory domain-containing protein [Terracidiphilus sp.]